MVLQFTWNCFEILGGFLSFLEVLNGQSLQVRELHVPKFPMIQDHAYPRDDLYSQNYFFLIYNSDLSEVIFTPGNWSTAS